MSGLRTNGTGELAAALVRSVSREPTMEERRGREGEEEEAKRMTRASVKTVAMEAAWSAVASAPVQAEEQGEAIRDLVSPRV